MCMEDVKLGREKGVAVTTVTLTNGGGSLPIVGPSESRTHLSIYSTNARMCNLAPSVLTPSATVGIAFNTNTGAGATLQHNQSAPLEIDVETHGRLVNMAWNGIATDGADAILMVVESFLEKR